MLFATKLPQYIAQQSAVYQEAIDVSKEINQKCKSLQSSFAQLSNCFERLSDLSGVIKLQKNENLFRFLSKVLAGTGVNISDTGELIKLYCGSYMRYHLAEQEALRELSKTRETLSQEYLRRERNLYLKKEKLFKEK